MNEKSSSELLVYDIKLRSPCNFKVLMSETVFDWGVAPKLYGQLTEAQKGVLDEYAMSMGSADDDNNDVIRIVPLPSLSFWLANPQRKRRGSTNRRLLYPVGMAIEVSKNMKGKQLSALLGPHGDYIPLFGGISAYPIPSATKQFDDEHFQQLLDRLNDTVLDELEELDLANNQSYQALPGTNERTLFEPTFGLGSMSSISIIRNRDPQTDAQKWMLVVKSHANARASEDLIRKAISEGLTVEQMVQSEAYRNLQRASELGRNMIAAIVSQRLDLDLLNITDHTFYSPQRETRKVADPFIEVPYNFFAANTKTSGDTFIFYSYATSTQASPNGVLVSTGPLSSYVYFPGDPATNEKVLLGAGAPWPKSVPGGRWTNKYLNVFPIHTGFNMHARGLLSSVIGSGNGSGGEGESLAALIAEAANDMTRELGRVMNLRARWTSRKPGARARGLGYNKWLMEKYRRADREFSRSMDMLGFADRERPEWQDESVWPVVVLKVAGTDPHHVDLVSHLGYSRSMTGGGLAESTNEFVNLPATYGSLTSVFKYYPAFAKLQSQQQQEDGGGGGGDELLQLADIMPQNPEDGSFNVRRDALMFVAEKELENHKVELDYEKAMKNE